MSTPDERGRRISALEERYHRAVMVSVALAVFVVAAIVILLDYLFVGVL